AKSRLETIAAPKIRGAVERILSSLPTVEESQRASIVKVAAPPVITLSSSSPGTSPVAVIPANEQKKLSDSKS
ncbi:MAG TPA: hypothetical protein VEZ43_03455, partial [Dongiaceae bacterium]|nr:hypothetical protein [Dongiaceae bacterium]